MASFDSSSFDTESFDPQAFEFGELTEVPNVVGETQAAGTAALEAALFVVVVVTAHSDSIESGLIISQTPVGGSEAAEGSTVTITVSLGANPNVNSGGNWAIFFHYEQERERRRRRKRELDEAEEAVEKLPDPVSKEIGLLLQKQEREDERRKELERLRSLVEQFPRTSLPTKAQKAVERVRERQSLSSLINLEKELRRMAEDEEYAVLMLLIND